MLEALRKLGVRVSLALPEQFVSTVVPWSLQQNIQTIPMSQLRQSSREVPILAITHLALRELQSARLAPERVLWDLHGLPLAEVLSSKLGPRHVAWAVRLDKDIRSWLSKSSLIMAPNRNIFRWYLVDADRAALVEGAISLSASPSHKTGADDTVRPVPRQETTGARLLYVGNLSAYQGIGQLLRCLDKWSGTTSPTLTIVSADGMALGASRSNVCFKGPLEQSEWQALTRDHDAAIVPRPYSLPAAFAFPSKVYDLAATGLPVVVGPGVPRTPRALEHRLLRLKRLTPMALAQTIELAKSVPALPGHELKEWRRAASWEQTMQGVFN